MLVSVCLVVPVHAQTISVSTPAYTDQVVVGTEVDVSFTANWSGAPSNYLIFAGVADTSTEGYWVDGALVSSTTDICQKNTAHNWADCWIDSPNSDGSLSVTFSVGISAAGQYSYTVIASVFYSCTTSAAGLDERLLKKVWEICFGETKLTVLAFAFNPKKLLDFWTTYPGSRILRARLEQNWDDIKKLGEAQRPLYYEWWHTRFAYKKEKKN
jgi:hypothetical protein